VTVELETAPAPEAARRGLPLRVITIVASAVLLLAAVVGFAWWDTHPNLIASVGGGEGALGSVGHATVVDTEVETVRGHDSAIVIANPNGSSTVKDAGNVRAFRVTIESVRPNVVENTSDATVQMELCTRNAAHVRIQADGSKEYDVYCPAYGPVGHQKVAISDAPGASMLAVVVTPHQAGVVRIAGFRISYREGIRRQTQSGGINVTVRSK
jgi:hypothetical protein